MPAHSGQAAGMTIAKLSVIQVIKDLARKVVFLFPEKHRASRTVHDHVVAFLQGNLVNRLADKLDNRGAHLLVLRDKFALTAVHAVDEGLELRILLVVFGLEFALLLIAEHQHLLVELFLDSGKFLLQQVGLLFPLGHLAVVFFLGPFRALVAVEDELGIHMRDTKAVFGKSRACEHHHQND